jgi:iron-sulfur cluster repair protein YtfE (RIC family)
MSGSTTHEELRQQLIAQHADLRALLKRMDALCDKLEKSRASGAKDQLRNVLGELEERASRHVLFEDDLLTPVLKDVDAWGPLRAAQLERVHRAQHDALVRHVAEAAQAKTVKDLSKIARETARDFAVQIDAEEKQFINAKLLTDSPINVDFTG